MKNSNPGRLAGLHLALVHLDGGLFAGDFFLGVGQMAGDIFMCYFNMVLNEITLINIARKV